ncbi:MAG: hypothetical protein KAS35_04895 [Candidatus Marinimicrobia bacterium]|nr:hypothetical protein [Candidatus Neomarinimicrobiota bacterium]
MRKIGTIFVIGLLLVGFAFAGGIVTNTNQSADFIRLMNRNASTDVDAVYFNPAGLTRLNEGLSFYLSSQTVLQDRTVKSDLATLNSDTFEGTTFVPVFPNFYVAYKTGNLAIGAGFMPIGGGGSAEFDDGLPTFEAPVSALKTALAAAGVTGYSLDVAFNGSSTYLGGQAVASYKINDMISVAAGARYFMATDTYEGHLKDVMVTTAAGSFMPGDVLRGIAASLTQGASNLQPLIAGGAGGFTLAQVEGAGFMDAATRAQVEGGLLSLGLPQAQIDAMNIAQIQGAYAAGAAGYTAQAGGLDVATQDIEVDTEATGSGFAPIFGVYLSPMEGLDIGVRYEGKATMELEYDTSVDGSGLFPDGRIQNADMPAMIGAGLSYKVMPSLRLEADFNYYFNEDVDWDGREEFVDNGTEMGVGVEFAVSDALLLSAGFLSGKSGAKTGYHSDISHTFDTTTFGGGGRYYVNPNLYVSFGVSSTTYETINNVAPTGNETYDKTALDFAIGIGFSR